MTNTSSLVSIILPIRNESIFIVGALELIIRQNYPANLMEIIVVDGNSSDDTVDKVRHFMMMNKEYNIKLIANPGLIVPIGMNIALGITKGDIIIRIDGHCIIDPDYVIRCVGYLLQYDVDGVGGSMLTKGDTPLAEAIALGMSSSFGVGNSYFRTKQGITRLVDTIPFPAYKREIIERVGFYDEELVRNQDDEYNYRIREAGGKLLLADDIKSIYYSRSSISGLWKQYFGYGYYKVRVLQKHPKQMSIRQFIPPVFVIFLVISFSLFYFPIFRTFSLLIPIIYLTTNLCVSFSKAIKYGISHLRFLPMIFAILHISYGLGFLVGIFKFWNRWGDKVGKVPSINLM